MMPFANPFVPASPQMPVGGPPAMPQHPQMLPPQPMGPPVMAQPKMPMTPAPMLPNGQPFPGQGGINLAAIHPGLLAALAQLHAARGGMAGMNPVAPVAQPAPVPTGGGFVPPQRQGFAY